MLITTINGVQNKWVTKFHT